MLRLRQDVVLDVDGQSPDRSGLSAALALIGPPGCAAQALLGGLAPEIEVETPDGPRPIGDIRPGDRLRTLTRGFREVKWAGTWRQIFDDSGQLRNRPVGIAPGSIGAAGPAAKAVVAPSQRIAFSDPRHDCLFGSRAVLCPATHLRHRRGVSGIARVAASWSQVLFDRTEVFAAGALWVESVTPDIAALRSVAPGLAETICDAVPGLRYESGAAAYTPEYPVLDAREAERLVLD